MKATVFSLKSQQALRREIEALLRRRLYQDIIVEQIIYDDTNKNQALRTGGAYLALLRASMIEVGKFTIESEDEEGNWGYYWDDNIEVEHFLRISREFKTKIFPGVAVMDRMVMVPRGIHQAIDAPTDFSFLLRPLDLRGVLLVDFEDKEAVRRSVLKVSAQTRDEMASLGRRYMSVHGTRAPDLEDLSKILGIDLEFLQAIKLSYLRPSPGLVPEVTSGPVRYLSKSQVTLEIRNKSEDAPGAIRVQIRAPWRVMEGPLVRDLDFSSKKPKRQTIEFEVTPKAVPFCPLEVLFMLDDTTHDPVPPIPLTLDVIEN